MANYTPKVKKGTTRELVSAAGVLSVLTHNVVEANHLEDGDRADAMAVLSKIMGGGWTVPTGTGDQLRTGRKLAAAVKQRTLERPVETGFVFIVNGVLVSSAN